MDSDVEEEVESYAFHTTIVVPIERLNNANSLGEECEDIGAAFGNSLWADHNQPGVITHTLVDARATESGKEQIDTTFDVSWAEVYWGENSLDQAKADLHIVPWEDPENV